MYRSRLLIIPQMSHSILIDQMGRKVNYPGKNPEVISLVPSITEYLIDLGVQVTGRTKFCIHPEEKVKNIPIIGGTKRFRFEKIRDLQPDLVVGNKEENYPQGIEKIEKEFPVWMSDIRTLPDAVEMMRLLGGAVSPLKSEILTNDVKQVYKSLKNTRSGTVLYLIWQNPFMAVGSGTFINSFLENLGYQNVLKDERYPTISKDEIHGLKPDCIFLSSEPFPFGEKHKAELQREFRTSDIKIVDGEFYSWYGTRILKKKDLINQNAY